MKVLVLLAVAMLLAGCSVWVSPRNAKPCTNQTGVWFGYPCRTEPR